MIYGNISFIFAIDPGNTESAFVLLGDKMQVLNKGKLANRDVEKVLCKALQIPHLDVVCERINSYGMPVGREVFDTCEQIGRFGFICDMHNLKMNYINRSEEKLTICHSPRANDTSIRRALIDHFAQHDFKNGKGTKKNPDWFYGFKADIWAAFAVGYTYAMKKREENTLEYRN